ncbi:ATPase [Halobacteriales archaeon QS_1_69_70]|nr:MAG: ATPase [Halobacteriales archaeon QS_1_69_70]
MGESSETIEIGTVRRGDQAGPTVELPVADALSGRSLVAGDAGSGTSNSAGVVCEKLLDRGHGMLIVDVDGEYHGLKETYEVLHVGADAACDRRVHAAHAETIAELAVERRVPVILDVSGFLAENEACDLLAGVTKHLYAKAKTRRHPLLVVVEAVHEYLPEEAGLDECGRMLSRIGDSGRKHGLGILGVTDRPAAVRSDFRKGCDWQAWHRLTGDADVATVERVLGSDQADHVGEMADGECFLRTDPGAPVRVVQFERKRTFDAADPPAPGDVEPPAYTGVSGDFLAELDAVTGGGSRQASRLEELERDIERTDDRLRAVERRLAGTWEAERMADRETWAMRDSATDESGTSLNAAAAWGGDLLDGFDAAESPPDGADGSTGAGDPAASADPVVDEPDARPATDPVAPEPDAGASLDPSEGRAETERSGLAVPGGAAGDADADVVEELRDAIDSLSVVEREMLRHYRAEGPTTPMAAHAAIGGSGERTEAYAVNRALRRLGVVEHAARGRHQYALSSLVAERVGELLATAGPTDDYLARMVQRVEASFVHDVLPPAQEPDVDAAETLALDDEVGAWPDA